MWSYAGAVGERVEGRIYHSRVIRQTVSTW